MTDLHHPPSLHKGREGDRKLPVAQRRKRRSLPGGENKSDGEERETLLRTGSVASNRQRQIGHQRLLLINDVQ